MGDTAIKKPEERIITFGFVKPHAYKHRKEIEGMIQYAGLEIVRAKDPFSYTKEEAAEHYAVHKTKPFFNELVDCIAEKDVSVYIVCGFNALLKLRKLSGATFPQFSEPWTIRGRFGEKVPNNAFHSSDAIESVNRELKIVFSEDEMKRLPENYRKALETYQTQA